MGQLGTLDNHLQSDKGCGYVTVTCYLSAYRIGNILIMSVPLKRPVVCGVAVERMHLAAHKEMCKYREYTLSYYRTID